MSTDAIPPASPAAIDSATDHVRPYCDDYNEGAVAEGEFHESLNLAALCSQCSDHASKQ